VLSTERFKGRTGTGDQAGMGEQVGNIYGVKLQMGKKPEKGGKTGIEI